MLINLKVNCNFVELPAKFVQEFGIVYNNAKIDNKREGWI